MYNFFIKVKNIILNFIKRKPKKISLPVSDIFIANCESSKKTNHLEVEKHKKKKMMGL